MLIYLQVFVYRILPKAQRGRRSSGHGGFEEFGEEGWFGRGIYITPNCVGGPGAMGLNVFQGDTIW
jgi:hypothetical protein